MNKAKLFAATAIAALTLAFAPALSAHAETINDNVATEAIVVEEELPVFFEEEVTPDDEVVDEIPAADEAEEPVVEITDGAEEAESDDEADADVPAAPAAEEPIVTEEPEQPAAPEAPVIDDEEEEFVAEELVLAGEVTEEDEAESEEDEAEPEVITGELEGPANRGYTELSDGNTAYCVEEDNEHVDDNAQYEKDEEISESSPFDAVFIEIAKADEAGADYKATRQIAQVAIWAILNPDDLAVYQETIAHYFGDDGLKAFERMLGAADPEWVVKTWYYKPINTTLEGLKYQILISGKAEKEVKEEEPEEPEPEIPEEPEPEPQPEPTPVVTVVPQALSWTSAPQTGSANIALFAMLGFIACAGIFAFARKF